MMNVYVLIAAVGLGAIAVGGSYMYGQHVQKTSDELATLKADKTDFSSRVDQALAVADKFSSIGKELADREAAAAALAGPRNVFIDRVIHDKPLPAECVLDPDLVRLRTEGYQALYTAAGEPVPSGSVSRPAAAASAGVK